MEPDSPNEYLRLYRNKKQEKEIGSMWSFGFFLATFSNLLLFPIIVLILLVSPVRENLYSACMHAFGFGFISSLLLIASSKIYKLRTIIHEIKHAVVVLLTGNKLKSIVAEEHEGYVEYKMYKNKLHFAPMIALAPYFFPLFSLPMLGIAMLFDPAKPVVSSLILGISLGADIAFGIEEIHPLQTDFKKILGGFFMSKLYLVGFYLVWPTALTLWVRSGPYGILDGMEFLVSLFLSRL